MANEKVIEEPYQEEVTPNLQQNGQWTNLILCDWDAKGLEGLSPGEYIKVKKAGDYATAYAETKTRTGRDGKTFQSTSAKITVEADGVECSALFFGNQAIFDENEYGDLKPVEYDEAGGIGDEVLIGMEEIKYTNSKGDKKLKERLRFATPEQVDLS